MVGLLSAGILVWSWGIVLREGYIFKMDFSAVCKLYFVIDLVI